MAEILSVEVGDQFVSAEVAITGVGTTLEVVKIWFEFVQEDNRWETSVTWDVKHPFHGYDQTTGKGRDFVNVLKAGGFVRAGKTEKSFSTAATTPSTTTVTAPSVNSTHQKWEDDFRRYAAKWGLSPSDLGRPLRLGSRRNKNYTIIGARPRNYKMPIMIKGNRGGIYKISAERAKAGLV